MADKRFPASPKRLREARERGEVPHSADLTGSAALCGALAGIALAAGRLPEAVRTLWAQAMQDIATPVQALPAAQWLDLAAGTLARVAGPVVGLALACAVLVSFLQVGPLAAWQRLLPDPKRLSPAQGLRRIFSLNGAFTLAKLLLKTVLLSAVVFYAVRASLDGAVRLGHSAPAKVFDVGGPLLLRIVGWACVVHALVSAADLAFQRYDFARRQRMSIDEVRREHRETAGDPATAARRRRERLDLLFSALPGRVRLASAVVHGEGVAVALLYRGPDSLPLVYAKGRGEVAAEILRLAEAALVPRAHHPGLAESLASATALDQPIPPPLFAPVATLLRWATGRTDHPA